ncbi:hypothetical protein [Bradyrhizobium sp. NBAIM01]|uniref:hypothetical protein n=1 Tax=Bradyrhizobium sp. NBAIM01 TaxID=2793818 RepID=UPI001CD70DFA|nr:hypothetical protein [Bradyrhizobium sp. NBAIM01]MCA1510257.1 hypothetical protein [Bradyrhizobium sp. NBAIM01]
MPALGKVAARWLALTIVLDALVIQHTPWASTIFIGLLEVVLLCYVASLCGVESVIVPLERLLNKLLSLLPGKDGEKP